MSRKIEYRVWDNVNKSYEDPYSSAYYALTQDGGLDFYCHGDHMKEAAPDVYLVEQYTGLKDKNGREIYEGDIVDYNDDGGFIGVVKYDAPEFYIESGDVNIWAILKGAPHQMVIGNIHENPEFLSRKEEE